MIEQFMAHVRRMARARSTALPQAATIRRLARWIAAVAFAAVAAPALASVGINKSFVPNSVTAGQVSVLTIDLLNPNASIATGVDVTDNLPANVVVAAPLTIGTNTCGFTVSATPGTGTIALTGGSIPAITGGVAGQCRVTINVVSTVANTYLNTIPANAVASSNGTNPQSAQATLVVSAPLNVTGSKAFSPTVVHGNGASQTSVSTLTITLNNPNPVPLTGATITDSLPAALTIATPSNAATTCGAGTATASAPATNPATIALAGGTIPANGSCTITVQVVARNPTTFQNSAVTNTIPAGALTTAEGATSPQIQANVTVQTGASLTKAYSPATVAPGGTSTLTITFNNFTTTTLSPIDFNDAWGAGASATAASTTCGGTLSFTATSVTLTGGSLGPAPAAVAGAASCTITLTVTGTATTVNSVAAGTMGGVPYAAASGTLTVTAPSSITGSKSFSPNSVLQGGSTTMTITLNNSSATPAVIATAPPNQGVTDNLATLGTGYSVPAGATIGGTCGSSITSALPATLLTFAGGTIPANGSCTITVSPVNVDVNATTGTRTNSIAANGVRTSIGNNGEAITGQLTVARVLTSGKAFSPTPIQAGAKSRLTVTLTRAANAPALTNLTFTDLLTTMGGLGFVVANPANGATTCTGGTVNATPGANNFGLSGGSLAGGAAATACTVAIDVQSPAGQAPGTYTNTLAAGAVTSAEGFVNAAATANLVISAPTSVTINKSFLPTTVAVGNTSVMSIQIRNNNVGAVALTGVALVDNLPSGMVVANPPAPTFTGTGCSGATITAVNNGSTVSISGANVGLNSICTLAVTVRANASGNLINTIPPGAVTSLQGVTNPLLGSATLAATGTVNTSVTKTNGQTSLTPGGSTTYTIVVGNAGPNTVAGMGVNDTPPTGVTFGNWTCSTTGGAVCGGSGSGPIADFVTIPVGGTVTYTVPASIALNAPGPITNVVNLGVPGSVINTGTTTAQDSDPLQPTLGKSIAPPTIAVGGAATLTLVLGNNNASPIALTALFTDNMPPGVTTTTANTGTCGGVTVNPTSITMASGSAIPSGGCTIVVGITSSTPGAVTNTTGTLTTGTGTAPAASAPLTVTASSPTLGKGIAPSTIVPGGAATLTLTLGNPNAAAIVLSSAFIDNMPPGVTTTTANTGTCTGVTVTSGSISMASGTSIPVGGCTIVVGVTSSTPGTATNTTGTLSTNAGNAGPASADLTVTGVPTLGKTINPSTIGVGGSATLTLTLGNPNTIPIALTAVFTDTMPSGVTTTGANTGTCTTGVTVAAGSISVLSGTVIPVGGCTIVVTITSSTPGTVTNTTGALVTNSGTAPAASAPLTVTAVAPTLGKSIVPSTINAGGSATLTLTLGNANGAAITLSSPFVDNMPIGVTTTSGNTGTCVGVTVVAASISMASGSTIPVGGCTIVVTITSSTPGTVTNTTGTLSTNAGNASPASADLTVFAAPTLAKSINPPSIAIGGTATLTLTLGNPNQLPITLSGNLTDNMPAGVTTTSGNTGTCVGVVVAPTSITFAAPNSIPAGGCTIVVTITSSTPGSVTNTTSTLPTSTGTAPSASAPLTVTAVAPTLAKTIVPSTIAVGGTATLTLTLANPNAVAITLASAFTDNMPAGVTTTSGNTGTCTGVTVGPTSVSMAAGSTIPAGNCTIVVTITSSTPGTVTNTTGTLSTNAGDAPPASADLTVSALPTLAKSINPATIGIGGSATLTLTLGNTNPGAITLTAPFTDPMPAGVTTTGGNTGTCTGVTVAAGSITMASGSTIPPGGCTIVVAITSATTGTVTNTTGNLTTSTGTAPPAQAPLTVTAVNSALGKSIVPSTIVAGGSATLTITLGNANQIPLTLSAAFTDTMPAGVTITGGNTGTCGGVSTDSTTITKSSGSTIPVGGCTIVVTITSATPGTVTNTTGTLTTDAGTTTPASAPLTVTTALSTLAKSIVPASIPVGGTATLTLALGNINATPLTLSAAFVDNMPSGVTTTGGNTGTCTGVTVAAGSITMASGSAIPPGGCTIVVTVTSSTPGSVTNTTGTLQTNAGSTPPASAPITVTAVAPTLAKTIVPATISVGGTATLTITIGNANAIPVTLTAVFNDSMPPGVTTSGANSGTCTGVVVTPLAVQLPSGSTIPVGGCTIVVPITSSTQGSVTNTTGSLQTSLGTAPPASAPLTIQRSPVAVAKAIAPSTIAVGGTATLTITLGNVSGGPLTLSADFVDTMPGGVTTTGGNTGTCTGVTVTPTAITMASGSTLPANGCTIVVAVTSSTPGQVTNTTGPLATSGGGAPPASAPLTVTAPGPTLAKAISPSTIAAGGTATLTITLGNTGSSPLTLTAAFTDTMPAGVTTTSGNTGTCAGVTVTSTTITMAAGSTLPAGGCTIVVTITSSTPGTVTNTTGTLTTSGGTAPPASAPLTVTAPGPSLAKAISPSTIAAGGTATLTITLGNTSGAPLTLTAAFVDTMPAGVTTTSGNTGTCTGVTVTATTVTMAAGSTIPPGGCTIVVTVTSSTPGTVTNTTGALSTNGGSAPPASAPLTVTAAGPSLAKTIQPSTIAPGGTATLTITLGNTSGAPLTLTAAFVDTMPAGVTTTSSNTGTCTGVTVTATTVTMAAGSTIPPGGCSIVVTVTSSTPGTVTNTTGALSTNGGSAPPASAPITVSGGTPVSLAKTIAPGTIPPGGTATMTITMGNGTGVPVTLTAPFTDPMPAGVTTVGGNTGTCAGVSVTPTLVTMPTGATIPPGGCTIVVQVTSSTLGGVTNVTSALQTTGGNSPPASAPVNVQVPGPVAPIPANTPATLLLLAALLALAGGWQARARRRR
ncbi:MAG: hypothetical protein U1F15_02035 [Burkholderiales bacterium]